jgi:hypothetical protein
MATATKDLITKAEGISTFTEARKYRDQLMMELQSTSITPDRAEAIEGALDALDYEWPKLQHSKVEQRREEQAKRPAPKGSPRQSPSTRTRTTTKRASGRGRTPRGGRARRAFEQTGVPAAARTTTGLSLQFLGAIIGLSLVYLLLTNAERARPGGSAVDMITTGVGKGLQRLIAPVDPLGGAPAPKRPTTRPRMHVGGPVAAHR